MHALRRRYGGGAVTPYEILDKVVPPYDLNVPIRDARGVRRITLADIKDALRIERGGPHKVELVAAYRHYDGSTGGQAGYYANVFNVWRIGTATWRSGGVRILPFEAERIARAIDRGTGTRPGDTEPDRVSGGAHATTSELRAKALDGDSVLIYVRFHGQGNKWYRSRGVEILADERAAVAEGLRAFGKLRGRAK